jgi:CBS domain-containing protein
MTIAGILKHKGYNITSVPPGMTIAEVAGILASKRIGAVLVIDADQLVGIVSERDIVVRLAEHGHRTLEMTASQLMTSEVQTATPRTTVGEAMGMMTDGRFRHVPVLEDGRLVGLVSIGDVVKAKISDAEQEVDSLRAYVAGAA